MVFSSLVFLCIFLPAVLILHSVIRNRKAQNGLLLAASLLFYAYGEPVYVFLMLASALFNWLFALMIERRGGKLWLVLAVAADVGVLAVFKYAGFLVSNLNALTGLSVPVPAIALPIGISFFTFQALSYVIDVYRGEVAAQRNYAKVLLYISFFPQLIAGPIVRYRDIAHEIDTRAVSPEQTASGLRRFVVGLGKKVLIANTMGAAADAVFAAGASGLNVLSAWIGAVAYLMQIYYDFSGYSDMAIGLGRMFGFHFRENFDHPYLACSVRDFWRRWHISLSSWFRDYVYIPLGGNRKGRVRTIVNRIAVFFLTGLWHGASWTFVVWGLFHGALLLLEEAVPFLRRIPKALGHFLTLLAVTLGFVVFRADTLSGAAAFLGRMFAGFDFSASAMVLPVRLLTPFFLVMLAAAVLCSGVLRRFTSRLTGGETVLNVRPETRQAISYALVLLLLVWCVIRLAGGSYNPFIYFRF
ncbi:MAG: MBOAT family protein [Oscillospiraceae bacterium]|nr:MBOAT family protein [Oscillospiraceae bacterium]